MADEQTKTDIVRTETVYLGNEHVRFLDDVVKKLETKSAYKATKSQLIRLLIECAMRRTLNLDAVTNEDELRQKLDMPSEGEPTRIQKK